MAFIWVQFALCDMAQKEMDSQKMASYQKGYDAGLHEGIRRMVDANRHELPLPISDEPGCDITPEKTKVNYLENMRSKK